MLKDPLDESVDVGISAGESVKRGECFWQVDRAPSRGYREVWDPGLEKNLPTSRIPEKTRTQTRRKEKELKNKLEIETTLSAYKWK